MGAHRCRVTGADTVGLVYIVWFNDLDESGQIANPMIAKVDPVLYYSVCTRILCLQIY